METQAHAAAADAQSAREELERERDVRIAADTRANDLERQAAGLQSQRLTWMDGGAGRHRNAAAEIREASDDFADSISDGGFAAVLVAVVGWANEANTRTRKPSSGV